MQFMISV